MAFIKEWDYWVRWFGWKYLWLHWDRSGQTMLRAGPFVVRIGHAFHRNFSVTYQPLIKEGMLGKLWWYLGR